MASILLVDGDATLRASFAEALRPLGEVVPAPTGADALRLLATRKFDLVLLEPKLPLIDGFLILRMLVSRPGPNRGVPLIVVTSDASEGMRARAMEEHARFVLTKPVSKETLFALCDATLHRPSAPSAPAPPGGPAEPGEPAAPAEPEAKEEPGA